MKSVKNALPEHAHKKKKKQKPKSSGLIFLRTGFSQVFFLIYQNNWKQSTFANNVKMQ